MEACTNHKGDTTVCRYSLVLAELVLAPAIPSVAARTGGIFAPIVEGLSVACGSDPKDKTERRLGTYLVLTMFQVGEGGDAHRRGSWGPILC